MKKRIGKRIISFILTYVLAFVCIPVIANAEEIAVNNMGDVYESYYVEEEISTIASGELCHCGGTRMEQNYTRYDHLYCEKHGSDCDYMILYVRTYYYCTNPACGDNYYSDWKYVTDFHQ